MTESKGRKPTYSDIQKFRANKKSLVDSAILGFAKKRQQAFHGCKAVNVHVSPQFRRPTYDFDAWARKPRQSMDKMEDRLDKLVGCDMFHEETMPLQGQPDKFVYRVVGPDGEVVDYMLPPKGAKASRVKGVKYETLAHAKKVYQRLLADPTIGMQRKQKSRRDLNRILAYEESIRKK